MGTKVVDNPTKHMSKRLKQLQISSRDLIVVLPVKNNISNNENSDNICEGDWQKYELRQSKQHFLMCNVVPALLLRKYGNVLMPKRLFGDLRVELAHLNSLFVLDFSKELCCYVCWPLGSVGVDNTLDASIFQHHFLMMAAALLWIFALDKLTHDDVDFYPFSLLNWQTHQVGVFLQKTNVFFVLSAFPAERIDFCIFLASGQRMKHRKVLLRVLVERNRSVVLPGLMVQDV